VIPHPVEINEQISKNNYYSFLWHAVFLALAINFMDVNTIIPAMMVDAGGSSLQLGILTAIMQGGGKVAQLAFAPFLNNQPLKKGYLLGGINARISALGGMALLFYYSYHCSKHFIIWAIFILISLFSFSGSFANINYVDLLGKSVLQEKRKAFFSIKQVVSSVIVFLSAFLARAILTEYSYPVNYSVLFFIAALLLAIASLGFWRIKEVTASNSKIDGFKRYIRVVAAEIKENKKLRNYIFLKNTQEICIVLMPFLILYSKKILAADSQDIGNFLLLKVIGGVVTGSIFYYYSNRIKYNYMLYTTSLLSVLVPFSILAFPGPVLFPYVFLAGGIIFTIHTISLSGILLEVTTNENRALYTGLSGAGSILPVIFPFLGGWIITESGFTLFFLLFMAIIFLSFLFIYKLGCKK